jgi:hypothetical protein
MYVLSLIDFEVDKKYSNEEIYEIKCMMRLISKNYNRNRPTQTATAIKFIVELLLLDKYD